MNTVTSATASVRWPFIGRRTELERIADAVADQRVQAALVCGRPGIGKSRLVEEYLAQARSQGLRTAHLTGSRTAAAMPLSALAPLLPSPATGRATGPTDGPATGPAASATVGPAAHPQDLFAQVYAHVVAQAGDGRFVLGVDDLHLLDPASLALLTALCAAPEVFLVASVRSNEPLPDALTAWWQVGRAVRLDLTELARESTDTLLHLALGAPVTGPASTALWEASRGNLLYLRELVLGGFADRTLVRREGVWCLAAPLRVSDGVAGLVRERLGALAPAQRTALERLALCEPLSVDDLLADTSEEQLTALEEAGLIEVHGAFRRQEVRLAHPLHAAALKTGLPRLRARSLLLEQIARTRAHGARRSSDALRLATWQLDATGTADPELLLQAASLAHFAHDLDRMRQLAEAALRQGFDPRAALLLGTALGELGRADDAVAVLAPAVDRMAGADLESAAVVLAWNCFYGSQGLAAAQDCLARAAARGGPELRRSLGAYEARLLSLAGRTDRARALLTELGVDLDGAPPHPHPIPADGRRAARTELMVLAARFRVLAAEGQLVRAAELGRELFEVHDRLPDRSGLSHPAGRLAELAGVHMELGDFDGARGTVEEGRLLALRDRVSTLAAWFALQAGRIHLVQGRFDTAAAHAREALAHGRSVGARDAELAALCTLVIGSAAQGSLDPDAVRDLRALTAQQPVLPPDTTRALAWADTLEGRPQDARERLVRTATTVLEHGERTAALGLLHDLARLGGAAQARALLDSAAPVTGPYAAARTAHVRALAANSAGELAAAAEALAALGVHPAAAEAWAQSAERYRAEGLPRPAAQAAARAVEARGRCEGATTPALAALSGREHATPLTPREREIAWLAARGNTSRSMAESLHLSVRTVDNHLQNIYGKLGIGGRAELPDALGHPDPTPRKAEDLDA